MKKILIVEDDSKVSDTIKLSIDDLGHFLTAKDLAEAHAVIDEHKDIAVAILDGSVPGGGDIPNTQDLLPKLLAMGAVIIAMSADKSSNEVLVGKGAHYSVGKPFKVIALREIVKLVKYQ